eukprot:GEZU01007975.1.p1 GENE.GEZU01007975.1~~GEZU01007975.1.p1  ORF type:complete len:555 (+),score=196.05 GEZU01007975.1:52-1665(+)
MTSLADEFMHDVEETEANENVYTAIHNSNNHAHGAADHMEQAEEDLSEEQRELIGELEESEEQAKMNRFLDEDLTKYDDVKNIARLRFTDRFKKHLEKIEELMREKRTQPPVGAFEDDPEYPVIVDSNKLAFEIDTETNVIHKFIRDHYAKKFPELEQYVLNPLDYARVVRRIGNEVDIMNIDLTDIVPASVSMVVTVTSSTTTGKPLSEKEIQTVLEACDEILELDKAKKRILEYVESRMSFIAPNLSAIVGTAIAAQLIAIAGGLSKLSMIPASNVQLLGPRKRNLTGLSAASNARRHVGVIFNADIINNTPPYLRKKASRIVSTKCTLAARVDSFNGAPDGSTGQRLREQIEAQIKKWQEPPPAKQEKPLPVPDEKPKKRRGGKRLRKEKERYKMTEMRKQANRIQFGTPEDETVEGKGLGMLGKSGSGKIRINVETKLKVPKKLLQKNRPGHQTSGLSTSLAFTPVQGFELENPDKAKLAPQTKDKYFSSKLGFAKLKRKQEDEGASAATGAGASEFKAPAPVKPDANKRPRT